MDSSNSRETLYCEPRSIEVNIRQKERDFAPPQTSLLAQGSKKAMFKKTPVMINDHLVLPRIDHSFSTSNLMSDKIDLILATKDQKAAARKMKLLQEQSFK